jgi:type IV secretory pathway component VirB8
MRSILIISFLFLQFFCACSGSEEDRSGNITTSENDVDAARNFIRSALDGKYDRARRFMIQDSVNNEYLDLFQRNYESRMDPEDKRGYREASINIHDIRQLNDTTTVVSYSNSYKKKNDSLKVVRLNDEWLVDLKYSFSPTDSIP